MLKIVRKLLRLRVAKLQARHDKLTQLLDGEYWLRENGKGLLLECEFAISNLRSRELLREREAVERKLFPLRDTLQAVKA